MLLAALAAVVLDDLAEQFGLKVEVTFDGEASGLTTFSISGRQKKPHSSSWPQTYRAQRPG